MTEGFTLTLVNEEGKTAAIRKAGPVDFSRNVVNTITITEATFDGEECGTVTSDGLFTVTSWIVFMNGRNWCPAANMTWGAISQRILILKMISAHGRSSERTNIRLPVVSLATVKPSPISKVRVTRSLPVSLRLWERVAPWRTSRSIRLPLLPLIKEIWVMWTMMVIWVPSSVD